DRLAGLSLCTLLAFPAGFPQSSGTELGDRVRANIFADLLNRFVGADELALRRRVDPVKTRRDGRRTRDAHVYFFRAGVADHAHDLFAGSAAHNGIVNQDNTFSFEHAAHRIQLELYSEVAHRLRRLDEGASHVVIADQAKAEWHAAFGG